MKQNPTDPTNVPAGDRRPVLVTLATPRPTSLAGTFRAAARVLAANGLHHGDYFPDPFNQRMTTPLTERPMSIVAAIRCATTGSPRRYDSLSEAAIKTLAGRLEVLGEPPWSEEPRWLENHVDCWNDFPGRTTESAVAVLYAAADASEQVAA
ncbi:hypothetical protein ACFWZK_29090 [[Kitasatospora] papulosa]|uniref:DUF6197 family protein n=1 Tax=[Kitasatospora] papulosa TaxID=1464011 RepID=UPI0036C4D79A